MNTYKLTLVKKFFETPDSELYTYDFTMESPSDEVMQETIDICVIAWPRVQSITLERVS